MVRTEWRATVWLGIVIAVTSAVVMAIASGASRTASAPDRSVATLDSFDALVTQEQGASLAPQIASLPAVASVEAYSFSFGGLIDADGNILDGLAFAGSLKPAGGRLVAGRAPDPSRPGEFVATRSFLTVNEVQLGDTFQLLTLTQEQADLLGFDTPDPAGPTMEAVLVGVLDTPSDIDFPTPLMIFPATLLDAGDVGIAATLMAVELRPGNDLSSLRITLDTLDGSDGLSIEAGGEAIVSATIRKAVDAQATGLWLLAAGAAVAVVGIVGQLITRHARRSESERARLAALGYGRGQLLAESAGRAAIPIVGGLVIGDAVAIGASGLFPTGFVRRLEPAPGLRVEPVVLAVVAAGLLVLLMLRTIAFVALRGVRSRSPRVSPALEAISSSSASATAATGIRFAFARRSQDRTSVRAALGGVSLTIAAVVAAIVFAFSLSRFVDEPARWGVTFELAFGSGGQVVPDEVRDALDGDEDVAALTLFAAGQARIGERTVGVAGIDPVRGDIAPVVLAGRVPISADEIGLGRLEAEALGVGIGDELELDGEGGTQRFRVTALLVVPEVSGNDGVGEGAVVKMDALLRLDPSVDGGTAGVNLRPGAPADAVDRLTSVTGMEAGMVDRPAPIESLVNVRSIPFLFAAVLGGLAVLSVTHIMITSVAARARDYAVLRSMGATRSWITRAILWQATAFTVAALAIGIPLGWIVGRLVFVAFADGVGAVNDPAVPLLVVGALLLGSIVLANGVALLPARRARRTPPTVLLRVE